MKGQRWKHMVVEGRGGEGGRGLCEKWWRIGVVFIGRDGHKTINRGKKT